MGFSRRNTHFETSRCCSQSGQGTVEYILLLVVSILLVSGSVYQFNDQFRQWANSYFGDYVSCLLETGELPIIGSSGGERSVCAEQYRSFSSFTGRTHDSSQSGGSGGAGSGSGGDKDKGSSNSGKSTSESGGDSLNSASRSSGRGGGGLELGDDDFASGKKSASSGMGPSRGKAAYTGSTEDSLAGALGGGGRQAQNVRGEFLEGGYRVSVENREDGEKLSGGKKGAEGNGGKAQARIPIKRNLASAAQTPDDQALTLGDYLRYILIAALVIALIVVLGSQVLRINQEMN